MQDLQLYSLATPNGQKVSIALEEMGLAYDAHTINILEGDQFTDEYVEINPNSKIPALVDHSYDKPLKIMESGAILIHLANKSGQFLSSDPIKRSRTLQWLFFQVGHVGPMFGQFGHFYRYAGDKCDHPYPLERYSNESMRLLSVIDKQLAKERFISGKEVTIADFAIAPWVICLTKFYDAQDKLNLSQYKNVQAWIEKLNQREAFQRGLDVCSID